MGQVSAYHFLSDEDTVMNKRTPNPCLHRAYIPMDWGRYYYPWVTDKEAEAQKYNK